jgi:hypothetical protein
MIEQLNKVIAERVKEVLQSHLKGTPEEFEAATGAVMSELSHMGGNLNEKFFTGNFTMHSMTDREELAKQLALALGESTKWE